MTKNWASTQTLLINWSTAAGFCIKLWLSKAGKQFHHRKYTFAQNVTKNEAEGKKSFSSVAYEHLKNAGSIKFVKINKYFITIIVF